MCRSPWADHTADFTQLSTCHTGWFPEDPAMRDPLFVSSPLFRVQDSLLARTSCKVGKPVFCTSALASFPFWPNASAPMLHFESDISMSLSGLFSLSLSGLFSLDKVSLFRYIVSCCCGRDAMTSNVCVAQLDRASGYGPEGREFESCHIQRETCTEICTGFFVLLHKISSFLAAVPNIPNFLTLLPFRHASCLGRAAISDAICS